jgi:hypothetical protein
MGAGRQLVWKWIASIHIAPMCRRMVIYTCKQLFNRCSAENGAVSRAATHQETMVAPHTDRVRRSARMLMGKTFSGTSVFFDHLRKSHRQYSAILMPRRRYRTLRKQMKKILLRLSPATQSIIASKLKQVAGNAANNLHTCCGFRLKQGSPRQRIRPRR